VPITQVYGPIDADIQELIQSNPFALVNDIGVIRSCVERLPHDASGVPVIRDMGRLRCSPVCLTQNCTCDTEIKAG
jgi:hypothetical protein